MEKIEIKVGETYGEGKEARTVTRITDTMVYWKRPGGKERRVGKYLPNFREWIENIGRESEKIKVENVGDIETFLSKFSESDDISGHIVTRDNKVTIVFEAKK